MPAPKQRKIAIVGSRAVGKSSLTVQFVDGHFVESYYPTIENTFSKVIRYKNQEFATEIIDTAGQDEYSILNSKHFIGIHGYMIVYSVASKQSFEMARIIRDKILNHLVSLSDTSKSDTPNVQSATEFVPLVIVGNKSDLRPEQRQVTPEDGKALALEFKCAWTEASARYDENVQKAFELMIAEVEKSQNPAQYAATQIGSTINGLQKQVGQKKKAKEDASELLAEMARLKEDKKAKEEEAAEKHVKLNAKVKSVGNYVHPDVPVSDNEDNNSILKTWAPEGVTVEPMKGGIPHHGVLWRLNGYDPERGVKIVGHRGYCLTGYGLFLNMALINYGLEFLFNKGYTPNQPPFFMLRDQMAKTAQLSEFDEELYKVTESKDKPETDKYLIATSEQPISALHSEEWLGAADLPIKYAGYSTNFRKEAGSHGKDAWGIFRIHQFEKVEQFLITHPEKSWEAFESMIATSEEFYQSLGLPYQIVGICSGALNNAASMKRDIEAWFPVTGGGEYKELVSVSNCTDYQTRELEIRFGVKKQTSTRKEYVHALNGTLCATERTLCCLLENFQTEEGFKVPKVLQKYIPGQPDFLPFVKEWKPSKDEKGIPERLK
ncbi:seryl-tRNA synthetase [Trematosphaeria pertusa]|uniref:serine--tRNA ligase n=1 Tax=Trematosphaeria pertusa TaxID=390896 RepID=A0A6A6ITD3_9PLEO|nr:seryl-tRNA synthetase [Trematosphaeria pertusa]KAF2253656.1 seryl-tRNA synthetase [Trematosphaeria pertusa]